MNPLFPTSLSAKIVASGYLSSCSELSIRIAVPTDLTSLTEVLAESFHSREGLLGWFYPVLRLGIYEDLRTRLAITGERYVCLVAVKTSHSEQEGKPSSQPKEDLLGTVEMGLRSRYPQFISNSPPYPYISNLAVHPQYRRQGVAQLLLRCCDQIAREWGFSEISLHVLENNTTARRLYYKEGYRLENIDYALDSLVFGQPRRLFLRKQIGDWETGRLEMGNRID